jgi:phenylalanyl-tRNA synthetase beta chain
VVVDHPTARAERAVRARLLALGYTEALSSTFASAADCALFAPATPAVALENPLSEEAANLRPSLLPGMVEMLAQNLNRDVPRARLFEAGAVFAGSALEVTETVALALGITGGTAAAPLHVEADAPFYELKGAVEALAGLFDTTALAYSGEGLPAVFEPGRAAAALLEGKALAQFGQLAHGEAARRKLRQPVWVAGIDLAGLLKLPLRHKTAREISRFQAVERDFSFTFPDAVLWGQVAGAIRGLGIEELTRLEPVEVWRNEAKFPGVYSTLVRATFQSLGRTLRDEELSVWSGGIIAALQQLGGTLRG